MATVRLKAKTGNGVSRRWLEEVALPFAGDECLIWPFYRNHLGRPKLHIDSAERYACRVICERVHGAPPTPRHICAHSCGRGHEGCVNPRHLRWATHHENSSDMVAHGNSTRGSTNPRHKLDEADVLEIRRLAASGKRQTDIATAFGVSRATICMVVKGRLWGWLPSA